MKNKRFEKIWNDELFILFMQKRFPKEFDENYIKEWENRFKRGNPLRSMDRESIRAYLEVVVELYGNKEMFKDIIKEIIIDKLEDG